MDSPRTDRERAAKVAADYFLKRPRCRDCADHDGSCPDTGRFCDSEEALKADVLVALRQARAEEREAVLAFLKSEHASLTESIQMWKAKIPTDADAATWVDHYAGRAGEVTSIATAIRARGESKKEGISE